MADPALNQKILKQVEFYFSDSNLPRDRFLMEKTKANPEGWVPVSIVASFNRMKQLSEDVAAVVNALKQPSELIELKETDDGALVRRKVQIPTDVAAVRDARSIYVKGFPRDPEVTTIDKVKTFLGENGAKVLSVRVAKFKSAAGKFETKGAAFVELSSAEEAKEFTTRKLKFNEQDLSIETLSDYVARKKAETVAKRQAKQKKGAAPGGADEQEDDEAEEAEETKEEKKEPPKHVADVVLRFDALANTSREEIKALFDRVGIAVAFIDYSRGQTEAFVRLEGPSAAAAAERLSKEKLVNDDAHPPLTVRALAGDEDAAYHKSVLEKKAASKRKRPGKKGQGKGRGNWKGKGNQKKGNKKQKT